MSAKAGASYVIPIHVNHTVPINDDRGLLYSWYTPSEWPSRQLFAT